MFSNPMKLAWALMFVGIALFAFSGQGAVQAFEAPTATETASPTTQSVAPAAATATLTPTETKAPTATAEKPTATATTEKPTATSTTEKPTATATTEATATATTEASATTEKPTATSTPVPSTDTPTATNTSQAATATATLEATATVTSTAETATVTPTVEITATATPTVAATETVTPTTQATATVTPTITVTPTPTATLTTRALSPSAGSVPASLSTSFTVQNTDPIATANISATFYTTSGVSSGPLTFALDPRKATTIDQLASGGVPGNPGTFAGSVVLSSDSQLAAVVSEQTAGGLGNRYRADVYNGVPSGAGSTSVLLPQVIKNVYDTPQAKWFNSTIIIQNTSVSASANVTITYSTAPPYVHSGIVIAPGSSVFLDASVDIPDGVVANWFGSAVVSADQPVAVIVNHNADGALSTYQGFTTANASTTLYVPQLLKNVYDQVQQYSWGTAVTVMTQDRSTANVTITYYNYDGKQYSYSKTANPYASFDQRYDSQLGGVGVLFASAVLTSDGAPIIATVNTQTVNDGYRGSRLLTYRAFANNGGATTTAYFPLLLNKYLDPNSGVTWGTAIQGQFLGGVTAPVYITYYNYDGSVLNSQVTAPAGSTLFGIDQRYDNATKNIILKASAVVTSTQPFVAIVNDQGVAANLGDAIGNYAGANQ